MSIRSTYFKYIDKARLLKGDLVKIRGRQCEVLSNGNVIDGFVLLKDMINYSTRDITEYGCRQCSNIDGELEIVEKQDVFVDETNFSQRLIGPGRVLIAVNTTKLSHFIKKLREANLGLNLDWWTDDVVEEMQLKYRSDDCTCCIIYEDANKLYIKHMDNSIVCMPYLVYKYPNCKIDDLLSVKNYIYKQLEEDEE